MHIRHFPDFLFTMTTLDNHVGYLTSCINPTFRSFPTSSVTAFYFLLYSIAFSRPRLLTMDWVRFDGIPPLDKSQACHIFSLQRDQHCLLTSWRSMPHLLGITRTLFLWLKNFQYLYVPFSLLQLESNYDMLGHPEGRGLLGDRGSPSSPLGCSPRPDAPVKSSFSTSNYPCNTSWLIHDHLYLFLPVRLLRDTLWSTKEWTSLPSTHWKLVSQLWHCRVIMYLKFWYQI